MRLVHHVHSCCLEAAHARLLPWSGQMNLCAGDLCLVACKPSAFMLAKLRLCRFERRGEATEDLAEAKEVQTPGAASCVSLHRLCTWV